MQSEPMTQAQELAGRFAPAINRIAGLVSDNHDAMLVSGAVRILIDEMALTAETALATQAKENAALREALAVFGAACFFFDKDPADRAVSIGRWETRTGCLPRFYADMMVPVADFRRARALAQGEIAVHESSGCVFADLKVDPPALTRKATP